MASLRPGKIDRKVMGPSYTRKEYVRSVPGCKIVHFNMGAKNKQFSHAVHLVVEDDVQLRHNCLEASRVVSNRHMEKNVGKNLFYIKMRVYPHQILRMNAMATGNKADRYGNGMRLSFGKTVGLAARCKRGQKVMTAYVNIENVIRAKESLKKAGYKLPVKSKIVIEKMA
ncbi:MAG: 50S ribosomal protein L16 [Candidatus Methanofastidiosa archaeon]|nr:50S ribosomal protein L16 [Candidatus Methanofastidiosa archaeon]